MACCLYCPISGHRGGWKNRVNCLFDPKTEFSTHFVYQKHLENIMGNLKNPFVALKNLKTHPKTQNQLETKNLSKIKHVFPGNFKVKNPLI